MVRRYSPQVLRLRSAHVAWRCFWLLELFAAEISLGCTKNPRSARVFRLITLRWFLLAGFRLSYFRRRYRLREA